MFHRNAIEAFTGRATILLDSLFGDAEPEPEGLAESRERTTKMMSAMDSDLREMVKNYMADIVELAADPEDNGRLLERLALINSRSMTASAAIMGTPVSVIAARTAQIVQEAEVQRFLSRLFGGGDDGPSVTIIGL